MVKANTQIIWPSTFLALTLVFIGFSSSLGATEIKITPIDISNGKFLIALNRIDPVDSRVYTITGNPGAAEINFGDGVPGAIPPAGENNVVAIYRHGVGGIDGTIIGIYPVLQDLLPTLIPFSDFTGTNNQEDISFLLVGLASIQFEFSRAGMLVTESQPRVVPEPATLLLIGLGLAGSGYRRCVSVKSL